MHGGQGLLASARANEERDSVLLSASGEDGSSGQRDLLKQSITRLGGSTTRLFSVALRDRHDLESMGDTLQQRVADMVQSTRGEFALAGCDSECQLAAVAAIEQSRSEDSVNLNLG